MIVWTYSAGAGLMPAPAHIFTLVLLFILLASCSQSSSVHERSLNNLEGVKIIENVPFIKQKDEFCGPAAMASVMRFYGRDMSQDEIAKEVYTPKLKGALISDMEYFAREKGYKAETKNGDLEALISLINEGVPAIVIVDIGKWVMSLPHYYVVYGYDKSKSTFLLHTGYKGGEEVGFLELDKEWRKMNRLMLIVRR